MSVLFLHPNFPGQFRRIAAALARDYQVRVVGLSDKSWTHGAFQAPGVEHLTYEPPPDVTGKSATHPWVSGFDAAVWRGQRVIETLAKHKKQGLEPDIIVAHPGWGDAYFVRDFFPGARVVGLFEYFYRPRGADVGFDAEHQTSISDIFRLHVSNATHLLALESCDQAFVPTQWQRSRFPSAYQPLMDVVHEGIDTKRVQPDTHAQFILPTGEILRHGDEVLTYVSRSLEPYRGFHVFLRALPAILRERPHCRVVIAGAEGNTYGPGPKTGHKSWKEKEWSVVAPHLDQKRVHFTDTLPYTRYLQLLQVSRVHVYLTYPFILSWSALEAMACGCAVLASDTEPVTEVMTHEHNAVLFPFHSPEALSDNAIAMLAEPSAYHALRHNARQTIVDRFDFETVSLPAYRRMLDI